MWEFTPPSCICFTLVFEHYGVISYLYSTPRLWDNNMDTQRAALDKVSFTFVTAMYRLSQAADTCAGRWLKCGPGLRPNLIQTGAKPSPSSKRNVQRWHMEGKCCFSHLRRALGPSLTMSPHTHWTVYVIDARMYGRLEQLPEATHDFAAILSL